MMLLAAAANAWYEVRVVTVILAIWTGLLGIVSLIYLDVFDWSWRPTWFWWFAYIWFPIGAAFIAWNQRGENDHPDEAPLSRLLRGFLAVQGIVAIALALALLLAPGAMTRLWPWTINALLAQIYSAPRFSPTGSAACIRRGSMAGARCGFPTQRARRGGR
jgi:hypothetical protein